MATDGDWILAAVRRYERPLLAYVRGFLGEVERSRDVVQDAFLQLCRQSERKRKALEPRLAAWLFALCRNRSLDILRKEKRMIAAPEFVEETVCEPDDAAEAQDSAVAVREQLARLPRQQGEAVRLKFEHGFSYREIGDVMGLSESHVGVLLHQAMKALRVKLKSMSDN
jgi:RNA polymerase sigma factor (sigma-70 family)